MHQGMRWNCPALYSEIEQKLGEWPRNACLPLPAECRLPSRSQVW